MDDPDPNTLVTIIRELKENRDSFKEAYLQEKAEREELERHALILMEIVQNLDGYLIKVRSITGLP
ncbi:hypothetical protein HZC32_03745, partial [Candidatus Woesearchaeota archaeon]|nr:hypothetical protein [Candidatus Woesearchaeota archaeon]